MLHNETRSSSACLLLRIDLYPRIIPDIYQAVAANQAISIRFIDEWCFPPDRWPYPAGAIRRRPHPRIPKINLTSDDGKYDSSLLKTERDFPCEWHTGFGILSMVVFLRRVVLGWLAWPSNLCGELNNLVKLICWSSLYFHCNTKEGRVGVLKKVAVSCLLLQSHAQ